MRKKSYSTIIRKSFTLLEILIVIVIVIILAILAFPQYVKTVEKTRLKEAEVILRTIHAAEKMYKYDYNIFTDSLSDINFVYMEDPNVNEDRGFDYSIITATSGEFGVKATRIGGTNSGEEITIDTDGNIDTSGFTP
ncbi:MAG: hypothetical protein V1893_00070 [Candidatus Omnitrophota bacterium]